MQELVECVANVSEGQKEGKIRRLVEGVASASGVFLLSVSSDRDHNRSVLTFVGDGDSVKKAALSLFEAAIDIIDLKRHSGVHPRIGAVDVVPFVPLCNTSLDRCVELARGFGSEVADLFNVPVYLYAAAAIDPERRDLASIRRGGFEGLREAIEVDPRRVPDYGPRKMHSSAGATAVGARKILIACNIRLKSASLGQARKIAKSIRERGGGLPGVRALGMFLESKGCAQVSMNLEDYRKVSVLEVFKAVSDQAQLLGLEIQSTEFIGHVPREALPDRWMNRLKVEGSPSRIVLEDRIREVTGWSIRVDSNL